MFTAAVYKAYNMSQNVHDCSLPDTIDIEVAEEQHRNAFEEKLKEFVEAHKHNTIRFTRARYAEIVDCLSDFESRRRSSAEYNLKKAYAVLLVGDEK